MQQKVLSEVSIIRPLVISLLVFIHSIAIYTGGWVQPDYVEDVPLWWWCGKLISGFRIEMIALIAGYVFSFQSLELGKKINFKRFVYKKLKRLLIPCYIFGVIYYFMFLYDASDFTWVACLNNITNGSGHLWFLPMLFWCFIGLWIIDNKHLPAIPTLLVLWIFSISPIPSLFSHLGFARVFHFLFYVYLGYFLRTNISFLETKAEWRNIIPIWGGGI